MSYCHVFTNIDNENLTLGHVSDLHALLKYLVQREGVRTFYLAKGRRFEKMCREEINETKDYWYHDVTVQTPPEVTTYDLMLGSAHYNIKTYLGNYMICDASTKEIALKHMHVNHIIEMQRSKLCLLVGSPLW